MPDEDFHLANHVRSQAHDSGFRRNDGFDASMTFSTG
jgi:hypothetical protein